MYAGKCSKFVVRATALQQTPVSLMFSNDLKEQINIYDAQMIPGNA